MTFAAQSIESEVKLFGKKDGEVFEVTDVCGPGPEATHQELHYSGDNDYASFVYENLLKTDPDLKHIGEFHTHPFGIKHLSRGDRATVKEVLKTYPEFIAGVMLRKFRKLEFYPVYFSREATEGLAMEVIRDTEQKTYRGRWPGFRRKRGS